jgi:hypothetical protein
MRTYRFDSHFCDGHTCPPWLVGANVRELPVSDSAAWV